jgi:hypothetical protein
MVKIYFTSAHRHPHHRQPQLKATYYYFPLMRFSSFLHDRVMDMDYVSIISSTITNLGDCLRWKLQANVETYPMTDS